MSYKPITTVSLQIYYTAEETSEIKEGEGSPATLQKGSRQILKTHRTSHHRHLFRPYSVDRQDCEYNRWLWLVRRPLNGTHNMTRGIKIPLGHPYVTSTIIFGLFWPSFPCLYVWYVCCIWATWGVFSICVNVICGSPPLSQFVPSLCEREAASSISYWSLIHKIMARKDQEAASHGIA